MIYFSADTHFGHENIIQYCNRPFSSVDEMDAVLIERWNDTVAPADTVYFLGDLVMDPRRQTPLLKQLNGHIHWIVGNHDKGWKKASAYAWAGEYKELKHAGKKFVLCHYPFLTWNGKHRGSIHLHGHSHGKLTEREENRIDCGVDSWDFRPVSIETILKIN